MSIATWTALELPFGDHGFPYMYGSGCTPQIAWEIARLDPDRVLLVTDHRVLALHGEPLIEALSEHVPVSVLSRPDGERTKTLEATGRALEAAIAEGATRRSVVVTFGGGVVGNLGGLVAAMLFRGVRLVHVPTTLMAAADAALSLKQAVNASTTKNAIGVYYRPVAVLADLSYLRTLSDAELRSGLCEAIKNCLAIRPERMHAVLDAILGDVHNALPLLLSESIAAKAQVMRDDPFERQAGLVLEYGHTVGHAIEMMDAAAAPGTRITHGDAVALGMLAAADIAHAYGGLPSADRAAHRQLLTAIGAPLRLPTRIRAAAVVDAVWKDNKRGLIRCGADEAPLVLLDRLGEPRRTGALPLSPVPRAAVSVAVEHLAAGTACTC